ncbi:MAG: glycoside hydrolase family 9 protein [Lachnospiraceae bacterium]|nr:glycoside hydrolase family 9 protein [Lachnospiraceae bacterium]
MRYEFDSPDYHFDLPENGIFVNQAGFEPEAKKSAVVLTGEDAYLVNELGERIKLAAPVSMGHDLSAGEEVFVLDFTGVHTPGRYHIEQGGRRSACFEIGRGVIGAVLDALMGIYYYQRCGCDVDERAGAARHCACHMSDSILYTDRSVRLSITGGWHDAGDYGRYVTAGAVAAAHLLLAIKLFGLDRAYLDEIRYELEWLLKMQSEDGSAYHKQTTLSHAAFCKPEEDVADMYILPPSSWATADLCAVCYLAAEFYEDDKEFKERLIGCADRAWEWLVLHPDILRFKNPADCSTGEYTEWDDKDNRLFAAAARYIRTKDEKAQEIAGALIKETGNLTGMGYANVGGLAGVCFMMDGTCDEDILSAFKGAFAYKAAELMKVCAGAGYGISMHEYDFHWGSNSLLLSNACILCFASLFTDTEIDEGILQRHLDYILGRNALGISYITGVGERCVSYPHARMAHAYEENFPGFVAGGPNTEPPEWQLKGHFVGIPPMKCYIDDVRFYSLNEVTIYWNSPAVILVSCIEKMLSK